MDAITLLTTRQSAQRLKAPAPSGEHLALIQQAALRAPDHFTLTPWRYIIFDTEESLASLGELYATATQQSDPDTDSAAIDRARKLTQRSPMIIACIAAKKEHKKIPDIEQIISAGCSVMAMQQAAFALGYGGIWRTGNLCYDDHVASGLDLAEGEQLIGFLYLGTLAFEPKTKPNKDIQDYFSRWSK